MFLRLALPSVGHLHIRTLRGQTRSVQQSVTASAFAHATFFVTCPSRLPLATVMTPRPVGRLAAEQEDSGFLVSGHSKYSPNPVSRLGLRFVATRTRYEKETTSRMMTTEMSAVRIVPVLALAVLVTAALIQSVRGKKNQILDGVIVNDFTTYEFYPDATGCGFRGRPWLIYPNADFQEHVRASIEAKNLDGLLHGVWRAKLNGDFSHFGWYKWRKTYSRELRVKFVVSAVPLTCETQ